MLPAYIGSASGIRLYPRAYVPPAPIRTSAPVVAAPTTAAPIPTPISTQRPTGPITAPLPVAPKPVSPISGNPVQVSIFQPTQTPSLIVSGSGGPMTGLDYITAQQAPVVGQVIPANAPAPTVGFLNLDTNTWLVLLIVLAAVIVMVIG
jgi:hypothetical protein